MLVSPLRCFKVSSLTTPPPKSGEVPAGRRGLSPPEQTKTMSVCEKKRVPKSKPRFICLLLGEEKRRYGLPPSGTPEQTKIYLFAMGKSGGTCRLMMQGISLCDHVTERGVIGQYELIVERERYHSRNLVTERDLEEQFYWGWVIGEFLIHSLAELKNVFLDVKTFRKYIVTSCRLFADKDDRYK